MCAVELDPKMMGTISRMPTSKESWETRKGEHLIQRIPLRRQRLPRLLPVA